jgi:hypothetical protein
MGTKWKLIATEDVTREFSKLQLAGLNEKEIRRLLTVQFELENKKIVKPNYLTELVMKSWRKRHAFRPTEVLNENF